MGERRLTKWLNHQMHTEFRIDLATPSCALAIAQMSRDFIEHGLDWHWTQARVREAIKNKENNVVVIRNGTLLLVFGIMHYGESDAHLLLMAVAPAYRRKRLASAIVGWLEASASAAGCARIGVECRRTNHPARHFYLEHGYHEKHIERSMYQHLEDGIHLEKWLFVRPG